MGGTGGVHPHQHFVWGDAQYPNQIDFVLKFTILVLIFGRFVTSLFINIVADKSEQIMRWYSIHNVLLHADCASTSIH